MTSWQARVMFARMWLRRNKRFYADPAAMRNGLPRHQEPKRSRPPRRIAAKYRVTCQEIDGRPVYTLTPPGGPSSPWHIFHMHGGGFVESPEPHHWRFAGRIVARTGCTYTLPMYPLAPENDHRTIIPMIERAYDRVTRETAPGNRIVFGDSAGGTLALTLARHLYERGQPQPRALALFSPWIDLATDDPLSLTIDDRDPELGVTGLKQAGRLAPRRPRPPDRPRPRNDPYARPRHHVSARRARTPHHHRRHPAADVLRIRAGGTARQRLIA